MNTVNATKNLFVPLTKETAPATTLPVLEQVGKVFGFVPNLMGTFANAPAAAKGYHALIVEFTQCSLTPQEQQVVLLTVSVENKGKYDAAAHLTAARTRANVPPEIISAVRHGQLVPDPKFNALVTLTREIVGRRGYVTTETIQAFLAAGYRKEQIMEILLGIAVKTISNYLDHISPVEIDPGFQTGQAA